MADLFWQKITQTNGEKSTSRNMF